MQNMVHFISVQINWTECFRDAEYAVYVTFDELVELQMNCTILAYSTFDQYADVMYSIFKGC